MKKSEDGRFSGLLQDLAPHLEFYTSAEARDHEFLKNALRHASEKKLKSAVLVSGGFHSNGMARLLKDENISYCIVMPRIEEMPAEIRYRALMRGEVAWKSYFENINGRVSIREAFFRYVRDELTDQEENPGQLLKSWRDDIIRRLAAAGRITEAREYTRFIDEISKGENEDPLDPEWRKNIDRFLSKVRDLRETGNLSEKNLLGVLRPATSVPFVSMTLSGNSIDAGVFDQGRGPEAIEAPLGRAAGASTRSELREGGEFRDRARFFLGASKCLQRKKRSKRSPFRPTCPIEPSSRENGHRAFSR